MAKAKFIKEKSIEEVLKTVSDIFLTDAVGNIIEMDAQKLIDEIDSIIQEVPLITNLRINSKNKQVTEGMRISGRNTYHKRALIAEAYLLIFKVREFLLEKPLNYRYYSIDSKGMPHVKEFSEEDILKYMQFDINRIKLYTTDLKKIEDKTDYQEMLNLHYEKLMQGLQKLPGGYTLHSTMMNKYGKMNPRLYRKTNTTKEKSNSNRYQFFNMGHIFEAMDIAFSRAIQENNIGPGAYGTIEKYMYGMYLNVDNIAGTKGGDNPLTNTQIKANQADILDFNTIQKDLLEIKKMLVLKDRKQVKAEVEKLFIDQSKFPTEEALNDTVQTVVDKILENNKNIK